MPPNSASLKIALSTSAIFTLSCFAQTPIIPNGNFSQGVMIATDEASQIITGYLNNEGCRYYFRGKNTYSTSRRGILDFSAQELAGEKKEFSIEVHSKSYGGFQDQITISIQNNQEPNNCFWITSADRLGNHSTNIIGVRVVRTTQPTLFDFVKDGDNYRFSPIHHLIPPTVNSGVWVRRTYGAFHRVPRFVPILWSNKLGTYRIAYIRERDLYTETSLTQEADRTEP